MFVLPGNVRRPAPHSDFPPASLFGRRAFKARERGQILTFPYPRARFVVWWLVVDAGWWCGSEEKAIQLCGGGVVVHKCSSRVSFCWIWVWVLHGVLWVVWCLVCPSPRGELSESVSACLRACVRVCCVSVVCGVVSTRLWSQRVLESRNQLQLVKLIFQRPCLLCDKDSRDRKRERVSYSIPPRRIDVFGCVFFGVCVSLHPRIVDA